VAPGAEGLCNLLPYTGQHVAGLCNQAVANRQSWQNRLGFNVPFLCACMQYCCVECSRSVDITHNFGKCTPQEHRMGDGSYAPCSSMLLLYAMLKLTHNAVDFSLLPPSIELDKATLRANMAYCVRVDEVKDRTSYSRQQRVVEGQVAGPCQNCLPRPHSLHLAQAAADAE
jgi:hypothetical protein